MDQKKKNSITGLVIGFVGLVFLFHFNFELRFGLQFADYSTVGYVTYDIVKFFNDGIMREAQRNLADYLFWFTYMIYILFVWFYRSCIGYWFYKIIRLVYKKI